jgi:acetylornithine/LysW-gamma-L-lysine aminotransferase
MNTQEVERTFGFEVFPKRDVTIVAGEGATLWDEAGRAYIDCTAGVGVASIGHANREVADAIARQSRALITCPGIFYNDTRARLLEKLVSVAPPGLGRAFLCNSGTESIEAAIKFARHTTGRRNFVCAMRGFHGRTLGALSATHNYRADFEPLLEGFAFVPFNNIDKLCDAVSNETAAVILELVQGEGGVRPADGEYLTAARDACDQRGALLIVDEVQTGFCRTGRMFACEHFGLRPDMLCVAKAMAGGVPMGAVLCGDAVKAAVGIHGSTFGGNPLACAAALATIEYMVEFDLAKQAAEKGAYFAERFEQATCDKVRELRYIGLMVGIELKEKAQPYLVRLVEQGVLALSAGTTVIRLLPPLVISFEELDTVVHALNEALGCE